MASTFDHSQTFVTRHYSGNPGSTNNNLYSGQLRFRDRRYRVGSSPDFHLLGKQFVAPNGYGRSGYRTSGTAYDYATPTAFGPNRRRWGSTSPTSGSVGPGSSFCSWGLDSSGVPMVPSNDVHKSLSKALSKVHEAEVNFAVTAVEMHKTVRTLADRVRGLLDLIFHARRSASLAGIRDLAVVALDLSKSRNSGVRRRAQVRVRRLRREYREIENLRTDTVGGLLLEINYGWRPLISDIIGIAKVLSEGLSNYDDRFCVTATARSQVSDFFPVASNLRQWDYTSSLKFRTKVRLDYALDYGDLSSAHARLLGLDNPFFLAWELVPYSFVVDWIIPISTFLSGLTTSFGTIFLGGTLTKSLHGSHAASWKFQGSGEVVGDGSPINLTSTIFGVDRTTYFTSPLPGLYYKSPFSNQSDLGTINRIATILALLTTPTVFR